MNRGQRTANAETLGDLSVLARDGIQRGEHMKQIPLGNGQHAIVDDEDYGWLSRYQWYLAYDPKRRDMYAATTTPSGRRVFMDEVIMGLDTLEEGWWN
jgi:hypothetical protein